MSLFDILYQYRVGFGQGLLVTLQLCLIVWTSGLILGGALGLLSAKSKALEFLIRTIAFAVAGIPVIVFLLWMHYPLQELLSLEIDPFITTVCTLSVVNIFSISEIIRTAIKDIPRQFIEIADVCGISHQKRFFQIELPLIFRHGISPFIILQVNILHMTLFASLISVDEIFRVVQRVNAVIYKPVEAYTALAIFFLLISLPMNGLALWLKKKYACDFSEK